MTYEELVKAIKAEIYPNGLENITGQMLQDTLVRIAQAGVSPSGDPMHQAYEAVGAVWNDSTGFWELNGLTDITTEQMKEIYIRGIGSFNRTSDTWVEAYAYSNVRTNIPNPSANGASGIKMNLYSTFACANKLEIVKLYSKKEDTTCLIKMIWNCFDCPNCISVVNPLDIGDCPEWQSIYVYTFNMPKCTNLKLRSLKTNINLGKMESISLESLTYLVDNAVNTSAITVTVHPTVYGYLTDQTGHHEWYELAQAAADKQISFVSA